MLPVQSDDPVVGKSQAAKPGWNEVTHSAAAKKTGESSDIELTPTQTNNKYNFHKAEKKKTSGRVEVVMDDTDANFWYR